MREVLRAYNQAEESYTTQERRVPRYKMESERQHNRERGGRTERKGEREDSGESNEGERKPVGSYEVTDEGRTGTPSKHSGETGSRERGASSPTGD